MRVQTKYTLLSENGTTHRRRVPTLFDRLAPPTYATGKQTRTRFSPATLDIAPPIYAISATPTLPAKIVYKEACIASRYRASQTVHVVRD